MSNLPDKYLLAKREILKIITAVSLLMLVGVAYYFYMRHDALQLAEKRATHSLKSTKRLILIGTGKIETILNSIQPLIEYAIDDPDAMFDIVRHVVQSDSRIMGANIAFKEHFYPSKGRWFEAYVGYQKGCDTLVVAQIGGPNHDYFQMDWFQEGMSSTKGFWSNPYYDNAGGKTFLMTYTVPVRNEAGEVIGVIGADITLDTLSNIIRGTKPYPHSFCSLVAGDGTVIVSPPDVQKGKYHSFTENIESRNMSLTLSIPNTDMYKRLRQASLFFVLLALTGISSVFFIAYHSVQNFWKLNEVRAKEQRIEDELSIARNIQQSLLPKSLPNCLSPGLDVFGMQIPAKYVGGDLYDYFIRDGKLIFCIGDVSGKGVPAALLMAIAHSLFRTLSTHSDQPERIMKALNRSICNNNPDIMFITMFLGNLELSTGKVTYCNAGHNPPVLIHNSQPGFLNTEPSLLLGVESEAEYIAHELHLSPGDTLLLYTDGLTEAENVQKELFGEARVLDTAATISEMTAQEQLFKMREATQQFVNNAEQSDDLTMLSIHYKPTYYTLTLSNDIQELDRLEPFLNDFFERNNIDISLLPIVNVALEEALANVIMYAYPKGKSGEATLDAKTNNNAIHFEISDMGTPFNPLLQKEPNLDVSLEKRRIGGLGIHLIKEIMNNVYYSYKNGKNVLSMTYELQINK